MFIPRKDFQPSLMFEGKTLHLGPLLLGPLLVGPLLLGPLAPRPPGPLAPRPPGPPAPTRKNMNAYVHNIRAISMQEERCKEK